jgi:kinesin family protein 1
LFFLFPFFSEKELGAKCIVQMTAAKTTLLDPSGGVPPKDFTFDFSYWSFDSAAPNFATNPKVYADLGVSVLNNAWSGYNCCLFAYGQTGSGSVTCVLAGTAELVAQPLGPQPPT